LKLSFKIIHSSKNINSMWKGATPRSDTSREWEKKNILSIEVFSDTINN